MKRLPAISVLSAAAISIATPAANAVSPPGGGLETFTAMCDTGEELTLVVPLGLAATAFVDGEHVVLASFSQSGPDGTFTKTFGTKAGLSTETFTCTISGEEGTFTVVQAVVPPQT